MIVLLPTALVTGMWLAEPAATPAARPRMEETLGERMPHEWDNLVGFKIIGLAAIPQDSGHDTTGSLGFGVLVEHVLIERWLEIELSANLFVGPEGPIIPIDLLLKKPFHLGRVVDPYVGIGPVISLVWGAAPYVAPGGVLSAGSYFWFRERLGLMLEFDYAVAVDRDFVVHELEGTVGPVYRF